MDDKLHAYINESSAAPPVLSERQLAARREGRRQRVCVMLASLVAALWTLCLFLLTYQIGLVNPRLGVALQGIICAGYIGASVCIAIVLRVATETESH
jgi:hypothetical protein